MGSKSVPTTEPLSTPESQRTAGLTRGSWAKPGAEAHFDGSAGKADVVPCEAERFADGDAELFETQVDTPEGNATDRVARVITGERTNFKK